MTLLLALLIAALMFFATVTVILLLIGPTLLLRPRRRLSEYYRAHGLPVSPEDLSLPYERFTVHTEDSIGLDAWLIPAPRSPKGTVIYLHGVGDCKINGLRIAGDLHDRGFNVFMYDSRRHGVSDGRFCTYGFYEKFDVMRVIDFLLGTINIPAGKIGIFGTSMGAAVALQAAAVDSRIAAVAAENSFATLRSIFDDYQKRMIKLPLHYLRNLVIVRSEFLARFKASDVSPLESVRSITIPMLFIYGDQDHLIRHRYSLMLFEAAGGDKELYAVEGASHNDTWEIGGKRYREKIGTFFERTLT